MISVDGASIVVPAPIAGLPDCSFKLTLAGSEVAGATYRGSAVMSCGPMVPPAILTGPP